MAVAAGFEITSFRPTTLTVVGGGSLKTAYGSYQFNLGPGAGGGYHEMSCIGMDSVTSKFNKYNLSYICAEFSLPYPTLTNLFLHYPNMWGVLKYICFLE